MKKIRCSFNIQKYTQKALHVLFLLGGIILGIIILYGMIGSASIAYTASPPSVISYQGKLYDNGIAVTTTQQIKFIIYNQAVETVFSPDIVLYTASGTTNIPDAISITPSSGVFAVDLGSGDTNALDPSIFQNDNDVYLEVVVDGTTLTPRKKITAVPYALNSKYLAGIEAAVTSSSTYIPISDSLGQFTFNNTTTLATTTITGTLNVLNGVFYVDSSTLSVGINTSSPSPFMSLNVEGDQNTTGNITIGGKLYVVTSTLQGITGDRLNLWSTKTVVSSSQFFVDNPTFGTNVLYVDATNFSVGINTSSPSALHSLNVEGSQNTTGNLTVGGLLQGTTSTIPNINTTDNLRLWSPSVSVSSSAFRITHPTFGSEVVYVDTNNFSVGINTSSPSALHSLNVEGSQNTTGNLTVGGQLFVATSTIQAMIGEYINIWATTTTVSSTLFTIQSPVTQNSIVYVNGLQNTVGINTINPDPSYSLSVLGGIFSEGAIYIDATNNLFVGQESENISHNSFATNGADAYIHGDLGINGNTYVEGILRFGLGANMVFNESLIGNDVLSINKDIGHIDNVNIEVTGFSDFIIDSGIRVGNKLFVDAPTGKSGINSSTPFFDFGIEGDFFVRTTSTLTGTTTISDYFKVANTGYISLGTTTIINGYATFLEIPNALDYGLVIRGAENQTNSFLRFEENDGTAIGSIDNEGGLSFLNANHTFATSTIVNSFNVTDVTMLNDIFVVDGTTARVGINTSTPGTALGVNGSAVITGTTTIEGRLSVRGGVTNPQIIGQDTNPGGITAVGFTDIAIYGDYAYAAIFDGGAGAQGIRVFDISDPTNPITLTTKSVSQGKPTTVAIAGKYLYVGVQRTNSGNHFAVYDISNPANPIEVGGDSDLPISIGNRIEDIKIVGAHAYITETHSGSLKIIDITNPATPTTTNFGSFVFGGQDVNDVFIRGNYAYAAGDGGTMDIIDISNPRSITLVTSTEFVVSSKAVYVEGNYAFIGDTDGTGQVVIVNISNPAEPAYVSSINNIDGDSLFVSGNYLFIGDADSTESNQGVHIIDISDIANPVQVSSLIGLKTRMLTTDGNYLFAVGNDNDGERLWVIDVAGATISQAEIGSIKVTNLTVGGQTLFQNAINIAGGATIGGSGLLLSGDLSVSLPTTTNAFATNTVNFSHRALFKTNSSADYAYIFDTDNLLSYSETYLFSVRNKGQKTFSISTNGDVHATGTYYGAAVAVTTPGQPGDLAEQVDIDPADTVEPGDVLCVDPLELDRYYLCKQAYDQKVAGVVSTKPTITVGSGRTDYTAVMALVGRVPVKASLENGPIQRGDLLVTATIPGKVMKYDAEGQDLSGPVSIVGIALDEITTISEENNGKIMMLVRTGWITNRNKTIAEIEQNILEVAEGNGITMNEHTNDIHVEESDGQLRSINGIVNLAGSTIINIASLQGIENKWQVDNDGRFVTRIETEEGTTSLYAIQSKDTEFVLSGSGQLDQGQDRIDFDTSTISIIDDTQPIKVSVTLTSEANGIYVFEKDETGFSVKELQQGNNNATYDWVVIAQRRVGTIEQENEEESQQEIVPDEEAPSNNENESENIQEESNNETNEEIIEQPGQQDEEQDHPQEEESQEQIQNEEVVEESEEPEDPIIQDEEPQTTENQESEGQEPAE